MSKRDPFDGFSVNLFLDEEGDYVAHFVELPNVSAYGKSPALALSELTEAWVLVKRSYRAAKEALPIAPARKEYSGQFNVRVDRRLSLRLQRGAGQQRQYADGLRGRARGTLRASARERILATAPCPMDRTPKRIGPAG